MKTRRSYTSKANRLGDQIRAVIADGTFPQGEFLPPETQLAATYGVSRVTLRRTLDRLAQRGILERVPHRGVRVKTALQQTPPHPLPPVRVPPRRSANAMRLGIVLASTPDEGLVLIQEGISDFARETGTEIQVFSMDHSRVGLVADPDVSARTGDPPCDNNLLARPERTGADGLLILPYPGPDRLPDLKSLAARRFPAVCIERRSADVPLPCVEPDNAAGMYRAANYLIRKHRRPAFFLGMRCDHFADAERYRGYVHAMTDAGFRDHIASHTVLHELGSSDPAYWTEERKWWHGYETAKRLLANQRPPISVACVKDYTAWGLYKAAEELNWTVGRDLFVTGFDDLTIAQLLKPALATLRQSMHEKGYVAARMLFQWIKSRRAPDVKRVRLPVTWIARESAG